MASAHWPQGSGWLGHTVIVLAAVVSGVGWFASGQWIEANDPVAKIALALTRTILTLLPAIAAFAVAAWRQRQAQEKIAKKLDDLRALVGQYARLQTVENELNTVDRLAKVARSAVIQTGGSANELFTAIEAVTDPAGRNLLLERYRHHTNSLVTLLNAVNEQLSESGRSISESVTADERINIVERADRNAQDGLAYAEKVIQTRGIGDGMKQLKVSIERAQSLQSQISSAVTKMKADVATIEMGQEENRASS